MRRLFLVAVALLLGASPAERLVFTSQARQTSLVELFTSEGCSSCPPADRWLSGLSSHAGLWRDFVPVGFHVTYWDYLGWKDRLASEAYTARQRAYADAWGDYRVYTPGLVVDGAEWRRWSGGLPRRPDRLSGVLSAEALEDGRVVVRFSPPESDAGPWTAHAALLGFGVTSRVQAGENRGKILRHDFVALGLAEGALAPRGSRHAAVLRLPKPLAEAPRRGLAVWVTRAGDHRPVQAAGGYLDYR